MAMSPKPGHEHASPHVSASAVPLTDAELDAVRRVLLPYASTDRMTPQRPSDAAVDAAQLASWIALIVLGRSRAEAGIADGTREAELWDQLAADIAAIRARGDTVEVLGEWFG